MSAHGKILDHMNQGRVRQERDPGRRQPGRRRTVTSPRRTATTVTWRRPS